MGRARLALPNSTYFAAFSLRRLPPSAGAEALHTVTGSFDILEKKSEPCFPFIPVSCIPSAFQRDGFRLKNVEPRIPAEKGVVLLEELRLVLDRDDVFTAPCHNVPIQILYWKGN